MTGGRRPINYLVLPCHKYTGKYTPEANHDVEALLEGKPRLYEVTMTHIIRAVSKRGLSKGE